MSTGVGTASPIDLATPSGRRRARRELVWGDHGFLRTGFRNLHCISREMYRANQPSPEHIARYARELGLKTILNLRGESPKGYYLLEREACARNGIALIDFQVFSREAPARQSVFAARDLFDKIAYPALMHCKSGADRAGMMAVLYQHFRNGQPIAEATSQLSRRYLHIREGKTGVLDFFFETYLRDGQPRGQAFIDWVATDYDPQQLKARFLKTWKSKINVDQLLRRE
jgi:protein tyrosine/serine phosphatase